MLVAIHNKLPLILGSHPLTVGLVGNRIARYLYYDEKVAAMRFRVDRQNSAIQPQSLGSHGRDRKIGLVGWQLRDSDFPPALLEDKHPFHSGRSFCPQSAVPEPECL